jgi:FkbH-like protein
LADGGALVGIASKNDPEVVSKAFERADILLPASKIFPIEVHWHAKSGSVERILKTWNIGADSVVFVDDSPMELAEVATAHPGIECVLFPKNDYAAAAPFLRRLRDLFGKALVTEEDALRLDSIRQGAAFHQIVEEGGSAPEAFLEKMNAHITFDFRGALGDSRVLELVNKTNQFNLNGVRYTEADWMNGADRDFVASVAYDDKFGPLGKIAVIRGRYEDGALHVATWVMSCRAFARRIEHQCLRVLLDKYPEAAVIRFNFKATAKNGPVREFFANVAVGDENTLTRADFEENCPALYHQVNANNE